MSTPRPLKRRRVMSGPRRLHHPRNKAQQHSRRLDSTLHSQTTAKRETPTPKPRSKANPFAFVVQPSPNPKLKALQPPPPPIQPAPSLKPTRPPVLPSSPPSRRLHHLNSILSSEPARPRLRIPAQPPPRARRLGPHTESLKTRKVPAVSLFL